MNLEELKQIVSQGEDSQHQFKEDIRNGDSLAAEMVAFSNSRGGQIFIGVTNKGMLSGLSSTDVDRINQIISNAASQHIRSPIAVHTENIMVEANRIIIIVTVPEGIDKPYFDNQGVIWLKSGADKRRINSKEELRRLFQSTDLIYADEVPTKAKIDFLNIAFFTNFLERVYEEKFPASSEQRQQLLENMNLAQDNHLNLAGLLLFGNKPQVYKPAFIIKAAHFLGTELTERYVDSEDFEGPFPTIFKEALAFIMRNLHKIQNQKNVNSIGDPEIPRVVFEELLVNALIHRDYFITAPIRIFVFTDRIEIINPGTLPNHLTVNKIQAGTAIRNAINFSLICCQRAIALSRPWDRIKMSMKAWPHIQFIDDKEGCTFTAIITRLPVQ